MGKGKALECGRGGSFPLVRSHGLRAALFYVLTLRKFSYCSHSVVHNFNCCSVVNVINNKNSVQRPTFTYSTAQRDSTSSRTVRGRIRSVCSGARAVPAPSGGGGSTARSASPHRRPASRPAPPRRSRLAGDRGPGAFFSTAGGQAARRTANRATEQRTDRTLTERPRSPLQIGRRRNSYV